MILGLPFLALTAHLPGFTASHPITLTRSSSAWAQDLAGNLYAFPADTPAITNAGLTLLPAATRLHGEAPANGANVSCTKTDLPAEGLFNPARVASTGQVWHRRRTGNFSVVNGTAYHWRVRIREGTSGRARFDWRDSLGIASSTIEGPFESLAVVSNDAGVMAITSNTLLPNGDRELVGTVTANADSADVGLGIGPHSATSGEYIDVIGLQVTDAYSDWIMGGTGTAPRTADVPVLSLANGTYDITVTLADGTTDVNTASAVTAPGWPIPTNYNQAITNIQAVLS